MGNYSPGKIRRMGRKAQMEGLVLGDNPFMCSDQYGHQYVPVHLSSSSTNWIEGWEEAQREEEEDHKRETEAANRSKYEIPLSEFETLGDLMDAIEEHKE